MPKQQNPYTAGVETVMSEKGFSNKDKFVVGVGGQTQFATSKEIGADASVFEDGVLTVKTVAITGIKEVTTDLIPEGTIVEIIY